MVLSGFLVCANAVQHITVNATGKIKCFMLGLSGFHKKNAHCKVIVCTTKNKNGYIKDAFYTRENTRYFHQVYYKELLFQPHKIAYHKYFA
ncbi:hypothetical protein GCM10027043_29980 [Ferruginibacter profundus]